MATAAARTYPPHWSQPSKRPSKPGEERTPGMTVTAKATSAAASRTNPAHTPQLARGAGIDDLAGQGSVFDVTGLALDRARESGPRTPRVDGTDR
jgi:hypothetical protein